MKLREIISNYIDSKDESSHSFRRLYNIGAFGMKTEFNLNIKATLKTVKLTVNPNKTVQLPCDYISLSKVGVVNSLGEIVTFKRNNNLTTYHSEYFNSTGTLQTLPQLPSGDTGIGTNGLGYNQFLYLNYWYGGTSFNLFGLGSGTADVGQYKVDETNRLILFDPNFTWATVVLEYLSDGCDDETDDYEVDIRCAEAMKCYLRWQDVVDKPKKAGPGAINKLKLDFYNARRLARMRINPVILNEMQNAERRSWKLVAKA